jgi:hypothetical protein
MMKTILAVFVLTLTLAAQSTRDVTEFTLFKQKEVSQVGPVGLILKETDIAKQRFKLVLVIDGHETEHKDQNIQIPILFYTSATTERPYELVVTKVAKDQISGRLVSPK